MAEPLPPDFVPENSDVMSPEEEYALVQLFEDMTPDDLVVAPRPTAKED
jgi:hypothetical protein